MKKSLLVFVFVYWVAIVNGQISDTNLFTNSSAVILNKVEVERIIPGVIQQPEFLTSRILGGELEMRIEDTYLYLSTLAYRKSGGYTIVQGKVEKFSLKGSILMVELHPEGKYETFSFKCSFVLENTDIQRFLLFKKKVLLLRK